jgi:RNA polymerase sigma-70 factor (ECF subfamily)
LEQTLQAPDEQDRALVRAYLEGQRDAATGLVDRYQKRLYNLARRLLANAQDAEDVTQTVFFNAFMKLQTFDPRYRFFSWIYRMTVNEALNMLKRPSRRGGRMVALEDAPDLPAPATRSSGAARARDRIDQALARLKPDDRAVVVLKHLESFSYEEIADVLDIPVKTVKSRLFTARERLRLTLLEQVE